MLAASSNWTAHVSARVRCGKRAQTTGRRHPHTPRTSPPTRARTPDTDDGRVLTLADLRAMDDDDLAADDDDESYNDYIDDLLDENESMSLATRVTRWLTALTVCGWPPVKGGADVSLVRVLPSTLGGSGVFARRSIGANVTVGEYPGVRRSLADYLAKCERTGGRTEVYSLMCRDGWVLDPTGATGVLRTGVDDDSYGMDDDSYSYGAYGAGTATPTVRLGWFGGVFLGSVSRDATMALCNEPGDVNLDSVARAEAANVGVQELATGTQVVFTLRDIAEGEELLWDYGESYNREHY